MKNVTNQTRLLRKFEASAPWRSVPKPNFPIVPVGDETFVIENDEATTSSGFHRFGLCLKKGDIPKYTSVEIYRNDTPVPAQFDQRVTWNDGSLKYAVCSIRDTDFSASESRTYEWRQSYKPFDNTGSKSLTDITTNTDFNVELTNNQRYNGTSNEADPIGATLTASFNDHAAVATRVTKTLDPIYGDRIHSGPICETWEVWGMCKNGSDTEHAHLKTVWLVTAWKDAGDNIVDYEYGATIAQDWWGVADKYRQDYDLALKDGATTIQSYTGIQHPYHSQWFTVDLDARNTRYAKRHFKTNAPTLHYKPNQAYWLKSGLLLSFDLTVDVSGTPAYNAAYQPCGAISHRPGIDDTGGYQARGQIPNCDLVAFLTQDASRTKDARTNSFAGLHVPFHHRSEDQRMREGESADTANTIISMVLAPKAANEYDFTRDGMPAAKHAMHDYPQERSTTEYAGGWVTINGGRGVWSQNTWDASHAVNYSYFMYLVEGERYFNQATLDLATNVTHQMIGNSGYGVSAARGASDPYRIAQLGAIDTTEYTALAQLSASQDRSKAWSLNLLASAYSVSADDDTQTRALKAWVEHNADYVAHNIANQPQGQLDLGIYAEPEDSLQVWQYGLMAQTSAFAYQTTELAGFKSLMDLTAQCMANMWSNTGLYMLEWGAGSTSVLCKPKDVDLWAADNDWLAPNQIFGLTHTGTSDSATNTIVTPSGPPTGLNYQNGDRVIFGQKVSGVIPSGINYGQVYYLVNVSGDTFQVSETQGGAAVNIGNDVSVRMWFYLQESEQSIATYPPYLPNEDSSSMILRAGLIACNKVDNSIATDSLVTTADNFLQNVSVSSQHTWRLA